MPKLNCWEIMNCGREPGGDKVSLSGICPASTNTEIDGVNNGTNGGRICWAVSGTFCGGKERGLFVDKIGNCTKCKAFRFVEKEEERFFKIHPDKTKTLLA